MSATRHLLRLCSAVVATVLASAACGETISSSSGELPAACPGDRSTDPLNCGACGVVCAPQDHCAAGACVRGCADKKLFVSAAAGNDANVGCTRDKPLKTIGAAIGRARTLGVRDHEAIVCGGIYTEPQIVLDHPLSIRGGFDCLTWTRPEGFGWPKVALTPETRIEKADPSAATVVVEGDIPASVELDGLTIVGPATGEEGTALVVRKKAAPAIHDCLMLGGATTTDDSFGAGSVGLAVQDASATVSRSEIRGGTGTAPAFGAVGVVISGGSPSLRDVRISAGPSKSGLVGIVVGGIDTGEVVLRGERALKVDVTLAEATFFARGLLVNGPKTDIEVTDSTIRVGPIVCPSSFNGCTAHGINAGGGVKLGVHRSRILGGEIAIPTGGSATSAITATGAGSLVVTNSFLHSGNVSGALFLTATGVDANASPSVALFHNTIFTAGSGSGAKTAAVSLNGGATQNAVVQNNILGSNTGDGVGVLLNACNGAAGLGALRNNAFVTTFPLVRIYATCSIAPDDYGTVTQIETGSTVASANIRVVGATQCATDTTGRCLELPPCTDAKTCAPALIEGWDTTTAGTSTLISTGWKLKPLTGTGRCLLANGGGALTSPLATDAFGSPRSAPPSVGAHELDGCVP